MSSREVPRMTAPIGHAVDNRDPRSAGLMSVRLTAP
jgi:hypothetical protein